jgi:predicted DNA-binding protein
MKAHNRTAKKTNTDNQIITTRLTVCIPYDLYQRLSHHAVDTGITKTHALALSIEHYLDWHDRITGNEDLEVLPTSATAGPEGEQNQP